MRLALLTALLMPAAPVLANGFDLSNATWALADLPTDDGSGLLNAGSAQVAPDDSFQPADAFLPACTTFDDLAVGNSYAYEDLFVSEGITFEAALFSQLNWNSWECDYVEIWETFAGCGSGHVLFLGNAAVHVTFENMPAGQVQWKSHYVTPMNSVNLTINGIFRDASSFGELNGVTIGGVLVTLVDGMLGGDCQTIQLDGEIESLTIGAGHAWLDCFSWSPEGVGGGDIPGGDPTNPNGGATGDGNTAAGEHAPLNGKPRRGDADRDGKADLHDLALVVSKWGLMDSNCDLNESGTVDIHDLLDVLENMGR